MWAARAGVVSDVECCLQLGLDVDATWCGLTPLLAASQSGHDEIVSLLLNAGADPNKKNYVCLISISSLCVWGLLVFFFFSFLINNF